MLCRYLGARTVAENLGVDEDFVARVLAGEQELEETHVQELDYLFFLVRDTVGGDSGSGEPVVAVVDGADAGIRRARAAPAAAAAAAAAADAGVIVPAGGPVVAGGIGPVADDGVMGIDLDGDNIADVSLAGMVSGRPGVGVEGGAGQAADSDAEYAGSRGDDDVPLGHDL